MKVGLLNMIYSSGLSWAWGPIQIAIPWDGTQYDLKTAAYKNLVAISPDGVHSTPIPMHVVNATTQNVIVSDPLPWLQSGVYDGGDSAPNFMFVWSKSNYITYMDSFSYFNNDNVYTIKHTVTYPSAGAIAPIPFAWNADF
jgi:hypothetical protein